MIIHIDTATGTPLFVMDQMNQIRSIREVYNKYGIHGIYYAVLFGWAGSPFFTTSSEPARDALVTKEVYGNTYYDPLQKEEVTSERFSCKEQYLQPDMKEAIKMINTLGRVQVIDEKNLYQRLLDSNREGLERQAEPTDFKGQEMLAKAQKELFTSRKTLNGLMEDVLKKEKEILLKSDPLMSLSDFMDLLSLKLDGANEVS